MPPLDVSLVCSCKLSSIRSVQYLEERPQKENHGQEVGLTESIDQDCTKECCAAGFRDSEPCQLLNKTKNLALTRIISTRLALTALVCLTQQLSDSHTGSEELHSILLKFQAACGD